MTQMARHHRHRGREATNRWDFGDLPLLGWLAIITAVIVSVAIVWTLM
jgi:hypothetical protein